MKTCRLAVFTALFFLATVAALLVCVRGACAESRFDSFHIPVAAPDPVFTERPEDLATPGWRAAFKASSFTNFNTRQADDYGTDAYVVFGKTGIFVALLCRQPSGHITATQNTNDIGYGLDDYAGVMVDTTGSGELDYYFDTTPNGTRYQFSSESTRYRPTWKTAASQTERSWYAELFIPFEVLRRGNAKAQHWRINFVRYVAANQQSLTWAYNPGQANLYSPSEWPSVTDIPVDLAIRRGKPNAEVYGLADFGRDRTSFEGSAGQLVSQSPRVAGIDAKIPITNLLNFVGTLDPDFSNVESDQQLTTPQEFRRQYAEYRPFFTAGSNFLPTADVLYTPNIGIFNHGEKIEGEIAGASVGLLNVTGFQTRASAFQVRDQRDNDQLSIAVGGAFDTVPGAQDDILKGTIYYQNQFSKFGAYSDFATNHGTYVTSAGKGNDWDVGTQVQRPNYGVFAAYSDVGSQYDPINGFVAQNDIHGYQVGGSLSSTESKSAPIKTSSLSAEADRYLDDSGAVRLEDNYVYGQVLFRDTIQFAAALEGSQLRSYVDAYPAYIDGATAPYDTSFVSLGFLQGTPHAAYASLSWGRFANYYLQSTAGSAATPITKRLSVTIDFSQSLERFAIGAANNGQVLRRFSFLDSLSANDSASLSYRVVSGTGGSASPGSNLAVGYTKRTPHGNELIVEIGSPAAPISQNRFIVKYVQLVGGGVGL